MLHQYVVAYSLRFPDFGLLFRFLLIDLTCNLVYRVKRHYVRVAQLLVKFCLLLECLNVLGTLPQKFAVITLVGSSQGLQAIVLARSHINNLVNPTKSQIVILRLTL